MTMTNTNPLKKLIGTYNFDDVKLQLTLNAIANLPTQAGTFKIGIFSTNIDSKEHLALIKGNIIEKKNVLTRIHSECFTGDVFHSLKCDCNEQLHNAMNMIEEKKEGILIYLRQEGRGIGLTNKLKAYMLQDKGMDTFEANIALGFKEDERDYSLAACMLKVFQIPSIHLITNNPEKISSVQKHTIKVNKRIPLIIQNNEHNAEYLEVKRRKGKHFLR